MKLTGERILVVRNEFSSKADDVERGVMNRLYDVSQRSQVETLWTPSADRDEIADAVAQKIQDGDRIVVAAGDGTANSVVNGYLQAEGSDASLGFLPYGNFNDMAATFTGKKAARDPLQLLRDDTETVKVRPLEILKNDEHFRYALLYATQGWTAQAAALFDDPEARKGLQSGKANLPASLARMGMMYFQMRESAQLPPFMHPGDSQPRTETTDVLSVNGPIMAKIIRSHEAFYERDEFLSKDLDVSSVPRNANFLVRSGINFAAGTRLQLPGDRVTSDNLHFADGDASFPLQTDGEFFAMTGVNDLTIRKATQAGSPAVQVLRANQRFQS